ncbi:MAG: NAD(P)-dependent oxidoreductase [Bacteroidales bacterium]|nr:NAD(P)-dependent oxidoreductase [Bacteroidales bacterium]
MRIFVTGASGYIGSYLVKTLLDKGHELLCLKRKTSDLFRVEKVKAKIKWVDNDEDWKTIVRDFKPEAIFNLAWNGVSSKDRIIWDIQVRNIPMQQELLDIAYECGTKKFIGIGSQSEYGDFEEKIDENFPANPKTAYAAAKLASLTLLKTFCDLYEIEWYWFRLFPVYGPYEMTNWLIPSLIKSICTEDHMDLTLGEQRLPYLYVGECSNAVASAIDVEGKCGIYNVCSDNPVPLKVLVTRIRNKVNPSFNFNFGALPYRFGQSMYMEGDTSKLKKNLYKLNTSDFDQRLDETIEYYKNLYK